MSRLSPQVHLAALARETRRARAALEECEPTAVVPSCPDWTATDLAWHLGVEVQDFWRHVIEHRPDPPDDYREPPRPADPRAVLAMFDERHGPFLDALQAARPDAPAWSWSRERTVGFTMRRQALEALVHRVDAEQAAGIVVTPVDPALAADGVNEVLDVFYGGDPPWATFEPDDALVSVVLDDVGDTCWVRLGRVTGDHPRTGDAVDEDDLRVVAPPDEPPGAVVRGGAADVLLWLWDRRDRTGIDVEGDEEVVRRFLRIVAQPLD